MVENGILKSKKDTSFRLLNLRFHCTNFLIVYLCQLEKEKVQMSPRHLFVLQLQTCRICGDASGLKSKSEDSFNVVKFHLWLSVDESDMRAMNWSRVINLY